jgi:hypothetical protein
VKTQSSQISEKFSLVAFLAVLVMGCGPRGETKSLDAVLRAEKENFFSHAEIKLPENVRDELTQAAKALEDLDMIDEGKESSDSLHSLIVALSALQVRAGYTTRPALAEILTQWRDIRRDTASVSVAEWKLLSARTYGLLSSELQGVRFALKERELKL